GAPLDAFSVRKLGVPGHEELAMGAIATNGIEVFDRELIAALRLTDDEVSDVVARERAELERRVRMYRDRASAPPVAGRRVIVVDDGLATGASMTAAVRALRVASPVQVVVAVPVAPAETCAALEAAADAVVCCATPEPFGGVGLWYEDFRQVDDDEVRRLLAEATP
ncbi:MAG: phosphoribosyltransferase, partial [Candidatus Eremiobacteraeota bacterium]|nr:phosphoribosyltransferase [Candidatus Eremiobacteraeota bacterium]